jgi:carotenoid cleavage dioxygenase-like enzyme
MAVDFRGHPMFPRGFNAPTRFEADVYDCEVWGEIPTDIEGTFYRIQCDFAYRPPENEWFTGFNGDGHVSAFRFANGSVDYKGRYVKTDRLMAERKHRRRLWGVYRNHFTDDPLVANVDRGAANTHIYWHGGKMLVLKEDALPYAIDPHSLETLGSWDFHGKWTATSMSAHPKIDPVTGEMIAYGYQAKGDLSDDIAVYTINPAGHIVNEVWLKSPYLGIIHDIAITQKYIVIPVVARTTSLERLQSGEPMWEWDGSLPTMVGLLPRDGDASDVRWFQGPARNTLHFLNAVDEGNTVVMDLPVSDEERSPSQIKRPFWRGSHIGSERRIGAYGRPLPVAALSLWIRRQQRPEPAVRRGTCRGQLPRHEHISALRSARRADAAVLRWRYAEPAGVRFRAAQGQHGRG